MLQNRSISPIEDLLRRKLEYSQQHRTLKLNALKEKIEKALLDFLTAEFQVPFNTNGISLCLSSIRVSQGHITLTFEIDCKDADGFIITSTSTEITDFFEGKLYFIDVSGGNLFTEETISTGTEKIFFRFDDPALGDFEVTDLFDEIDSWIEF